MNFDIVCDSSADLSLSEFRSLQVTVVPFYVSLDGVHYLKEGMELSIPDFYFNMAEHEDCFPRTSMPSVQDYIDAFLPFVRINHPVLCICLTKLFSGSFQSALNAKQAILDEYPNAEIAVMDSCLVTALEGLFVTEAVRLRDSGLSLSEAVDKLQCIRQSGQIFFTTKDLKYLEHGGRLSKAARIAGSMLNLKPILHFANGDLDRPEVCRGRKKSFNRVIEEFFCYVDKNDLDLSQYLFATGIGAPVAEYDSFRADVQAEFDRRGVRPASWFRIQIGATIGVHTGPYPVGLGILKKCVI